LTGAGRRPSGSPGFRAPLRCHHREKALQVVVTGFFFLGIMLALTMADYLTRGALGILGK